MPCYHPVVMKELLCETTGQLFYIQPGQKPDPQYFWKQTREFKRPCGQCVGCRSRRVLDKANQIEHESRYHDENSFVTLTVANDYMDDVFPRGSLCYSPFQSWMKRFRQKIGKPLRFFMCGEYGEQFNRPHYHAIIFGWFPGSEKRTFYKQTSAGILYYSHEIDDTWKYGANTVAYYDYSCGAYVAGYIQKKLNGKLLGLYNGKMPEFSKQSNGGGARKGRAKFGTPEYQYVPMGLGAKFYQDFKKQMYTRDSLTQLGGQRQPLPKYYDKLHNHYHPANMLAWKKNRMVETPQMIEESRPERLRVRETVHKSRLKQHIRPMERKA